MFLFGKKKKDEQPSDAKVSTAFTLSVMVFKKLYGHEQKEAEELAFTTVENWIIEDKLDKAIKRLWQAKIA